MGVFCIALKQVALEELLPNFVGNPTERYGFTD
jgi:hypothetical protein